MLRLSRIKWKPPYGERYWAYVNSPEGSWKTDKEIEALWDAYPYSLFESYREDGIVITEVNNAHYLNPHS